MKSFHKEVTITLGFPFAYYLLRLNRLKLGTWDQPKGIGVDKGRRDKPTPLGYTQDCAVWEFDAHSVRLNNIAEIPPSTAIAVIRSPNHASRCI